MISEYRSTKIEYWDKCTTVIIIKILILTVEVLGFFPRGKLILYVNDIKVNSGNNYVLIPLHLFWPLGLEIRFVWKRVLLLKSESENTEGMKSLWNMSDQNHCKDLPGDNISDVHWVPADSDLEATWYHSLAASRFWSPWRLGGFTELSSLFPLCWCAPETFCIKPLENSQTYIFFLDY